MYWAKWTEKESGERRSGAWGSPACMRQWQNGTCSDTWRQPQIAKLPLQWGNRQVQEWCDDRCDQKGIKCSYFTLQATGRVLIALNNDQLGAMWRETYSFCHVEQDRRHRHTVDMDGETTDAKTRHERHRRMQVGDNSSRSTWMGGDAKNHRKSHDGANNISKWPYEGMQPPPINTKKIEGMETCHH